MDLDQICNGREYRGPRSAMTPLTTSDQSENERAQEGLHNNENASNTTRHREKGLESFETKTEEVVGANRKRITEDNDDLHPERAYVEALGVSILRMERTLRLLQSQAIEQTSEMPRAKAEKAEEAPLPIKLEENEEDNHPQFPQLPGSAKAPKANTALLRTKKEDTQHSAALHVLPSMIRPSNFPEHVAEFFSVRAEETNSAKIGLPERSTLPKAQIADLKVTGPAAIPTSAHITSLFSHNAEDRGPAFDRNALPDVAGNEHRESQIQDGKWVCSIYETKLGDKWAYEKHIKTCQKLSCEMCGIEFKGQRARTHHKAHTKDCIREKPGKILTCRGCNAPFYGTWASASRGSHERAHRNGLA